MKLLKALLASGLFLTIYALIYLCHIHFFTVDVVFYAALLDAVIAVIISALIFVYGRRFRNFSRFEKSQLVLIWVLMGYAIAISGPTVIDRSLSFYLLEKLQQRANERLTRVYPGILRYASDNMSPLLAWRLGFHQVALNSQTCDLPMQARG